MPICQRFQELQLELQKQGFASRHQEEAEGPSQAPSFADVAQRTMRRLASDARSRVAQRSAESNPGTATAADGQHPAGGSATTVASHRLGWLAANRAMNSAGRQQQHLG